MNFKIGQKVVCICSDSWEDVQTGKECFIYPEHGEVVTIDGFGDAGYLTFKEFPQMEPRKFLWMTYKLERICFDPREFKPVIAIESREQLEYQTKELSQCYTTLN